MRPISTGRREFLQVAGVSAMATASTGIGMRWAEAQQVRYSTGTEPEVATLIRSARRQAPAMWVAQ